MNADRWMGDGSPLAAEPGYVRHAGGRIVAFIYKDGATWRAWAKLGERWVDVGRYAGPEPAGLAADAYLDAIDIHAPGDAPADGPGDCSHAAAW